MGIIYLVDFLSCCEYTSSCQDITWLTLKRKRSLSVAFTSACPNRAGLIFVFPPFSLLRHKTDEFSLIFQVGLMAGDAPA